MSLVFSCSSIYFHSIVMNDNKLLACLDAKSDFRGRERERERSVEKELTRTCPGASTKSQIRRVVLKEGKKRKKCFFFYTILLIILPIRDVLSVLYKYQLDIPLLKYLYTRVYYLDSCYFLLIGFLNLKCVTQKRANSHFNVRNIEQPCFVFFFLFKKKIHV